jgi:hypothetical protein
VATGYDPLLDNAPERAHYGGRGSAAPCLWRTRRAERTPHALSPTPRQQGVDGAETATGTPSWHWARLWGRVFALARATCPCYRRGALRLMAATPQASVIPRSLQPLTLAAVPPPIAPARCRPKRCAVDCVHDRARSLGGAGRAVAGYFPPLRLCHPVGNALSPACYTGRPAALALGHPCGGSLPHPARPGYAALYRAVPCCAPLRRAAAGTATQGLWMSFYVAAVGQPSCVCLPSLHSLGPGSTGPAGSGGFLWRWDPASPTTFSPCACPHPSPEPLCGFRRGLEDRWEATPSLRRLLQ